MRSLTLILPLALFVALILAPAAAPAQDPQPAQPTDPAGGITLKWEAPEVGAVRIEKSATQWDWTLQIKLGGEVKAQAELGRITAQHKREQTLALNGRAPSKVLVAYTEWKGMNTRSGAQPQQMDLPGHGRSYVLENRTGEPEDIDIRTLDGEGVILNEARSIVGDVSVGRIPMLAQLFDGKTLKPGDKVVPTEEQAQRMWGERYISASYEFAGTREERGMHCAVFNVQIRTKLLMPNNSELTFNHSGELLLMAETLWPVSVKYSGPIEVGGTTEHQAGTLQFAGTGKATTNSTFSYSAEIVPDRKGVTMQPGTARRPSVHDFTVTTLDGKEKKLADYKGKVLLIVNTASKCGFTPQYKELEALYQKYKDQGVVVLGFPCNDFGGQEPGSADEIQKFCTDNYQVTFPMFSKVTIAPGENQSKLYAFMAECAGALPRWNFFKYLVDQEGNVRVLWEPPVTPLSPTVTNAIETLLKGGADEGGDGGE